MPNITFLDASTLGFADFSELEQLGKFTSFPTTELQDLLERSENAEVLITNKVVLNAETLKQLPKLKLICVAATGTNCIDLDAAKELGIKVKNVAGYSTPSVCQHTIGMLINLASNIHLYNQDIASWPEAPIFNQLHHPIFDLAGKTLGIIGYGTIGKEVAKVAQSLGMQIIALERKSPANHAASGDPMRKSYEEFFAQADFISLHCPLTSETKEIINVDSLSLMKPTAFVINTGRGDLINEIDLLKALQRKTIAGAALDVLTSEPPPADHPLLVAKEAGLSNLMITPHTAWAAVESRDKLISGVTNNIRTFLLE